MYTISYIYYYISSKNYIPNLTNKSVIKYQLIFKSFQCLNNIGLLGQVNNKVLGQNNNLQSITQLMCLI